MRRVGFYLDSHEPAALNLASRAIVAVRWAMPDAEIWHLTTEQGPGLLEADAEHRREAYGPPALRRAIVQSDVPAGMLLLDTDILMCADVSELADLAAAADVLLPEVSDPYVRYTGGVMMVNNTAFWAGWLRDPVWDGSLDVRSLLTGFTRYIDGCGLNIVRVPEARYEYLPRDAGDLGEQDTALVHFRGPRKRWFPDA